MVVITPAVSVILPTYVLWFKKLKSVVVTLVVMSPPFTARSVWTLRFPLNATFPITANATAYQLLSAVPFSWALVVLMPTLPLFVVDSLNTE